MNRLLAGTTIVSSLLLVHCGNSAGSHGGTLGHGGSPSAGSSSSSSAGGAGGVSAGAGFGGSFAQVGSGAGPDAGTGAGTGGGGSGTIMTVIRDFRFYDATDATTNPDFENPPYTLDAQGNTVANYQGPWDDHAIVTTTLGADGKPVYMNTTGTTLTTHGQASFDQWYNDVPNTNIRVLWPLPLTQNADGTYGYESSVSGVPYNISGQTGNGFFPIDDGSPYATAFGNQGKPHNYSFTLELHTTFTYRGGETFDFRGDDDVFVYINKNLVINLGGIHGPETQSVSIDTLGLTVGTSYPLDFFSAERHVTGSNIGFTTTLQLVSVPITN